MLLLIDSPSVTYLVLIAFFQRIELFLKTKTGSNLLNMVPYQDTVFEIRSKIDFLLLCPRPYGTGH